jgi:hypothetical protein
MTHALNAAGYEPPHVPAGSPDGGQFGPTGGGKAPARTPKKTVPKKTTRPAAHDNGTLAFDPKSNHGTGYGTPHGDPRVHRLQQALNRLGMTDAEGHPLLLDGKLGPRTTAAVKKAQQQFGLPQDGKVTPALLARLTAAKTPAKHTPAPAKHAPAKPAPAKPAPAKHVQKVTYAAVDPQQPYGDVAYADPGYQSDGKKRYPLDSEAHCRAAWSYINMPGNAAMYTAQQVTDIKAKIKAAGQKYGVDFADGQKMQASSDLKSVEIARPGTWKLSSGELTVTPEMLADAARYAQRPGARPSPVKLGHSDPRFAGDGEPSLGWLGNLRVEDDNGPVLVGDITGMPDWLAAAAPTAWPDRSMEGWTDYEDDGETYSLVVDGLALLGVTPPGMSSIRSLRDLPQALGVAASARIVARAPDPPPDPATGAPPSAGLFAARTPALEAEAPTKKEIRVDPVKIREALDLQSDASEDEVMAAIVTAGLAPPAPDPAPVQASLFDPPAAPPTAAPAREMAGTMRVDASAWEAAQDRIKRLEAAADKQRVAERDQIIAKAVQDGKFAPARREHWVRLWDADPEGAREAIDGLARNVIPVTASGYSDADGEELDREYASLFPPTTRKGA